MVCGPCCPTLLTASLLFLVALGPPGSRAERHHLQRGITRSAFLASGVQQDCPAGSEPGSAASPQFVVFTAARDEAPYIEEFVQYHLAIGVDLIYVYGT